MTAGDNPEKDIEKELGYILSDPKRKHIVLGDWVDSIALWLGENFEKDGKPVDMAMASDKLAKIMNFKCGKANVLEEFKPKAAAFICRTFTRKT